MPVTDLTDTTWILNDAITFSSSLGLSNIISFNFTSNNTSFYGFYFDFNSDGDNSLGYRTNQEYSYVEIYNSSGNIIAGKEAYKTITITGGTDATNSALISWLESNATQQTVSTKVSVDLTTLPGWSSLSSGTHNITIVAKADGYRDSEPSEAVSVTKGENPTDCIVFSSPNSFTLYTAGNVKLWDGTLEYSTDGISWSQWSGTTTLNSSASGKLYIRGTGNTKITGSGASASKGRWRFTGSDISCSGNIENLLDYATVANGGHPTMGQYCYYSLFYSASALITAPELPATTLINSCYESMFVSSAITTLPKLPATTLAKRCYYNMFYACTGIKLSTTQEGEYQTAYRIPTSGTGTTAQDALSYMFRSTGGTIAGTNNGTPSINKTYYTSNTVV